MSYRHILLFISLEEAEEHCITSSIELLARAALENIQSVKWYSDVKHEEVESGDNLMRLALIGQAHEKFDFTLENYLSYVVLNDPVLAIGDKVIAISPILSTDTEVEIVGIETRFDDEVEYTVKGSGCDGWKFPETHLFHKETMVAYHEEMIKSLKK